MRTDMIVMGGGIAGMTAARRTVQLGGSVIVLEKGTDVRYPCNSRFTGGALHVCYRDPTAEPAVLRQAINETTAGTARPDIVEALAQNSARVIDWVKQQGAILVKGGAEEYKRWVLTPLRPQRRGLFWKGLGGDVMLRGLEQRIIETGSTIRRGSQVTHIERRDDGWRVSTGDGASFSAPAVVIADGGFQADPKALRRHISPRPEHLLQRGAATGGGDGLRLAIELGAETVGLDRFYGHVMLADALERDDLWPYPWLDGIASSGIVVDGHGRRFVDEGKGGVFIANAIARLPEPLSAWAIFDTAIWRGPATRGVIPANPNVSLAGIVFPQAKTVSGLGAQTGIDPISLSETVEAYNLAVETGKTGALSPARTVSPSTLPIVRAPFKAARLVAGITYTMGGIAIDGHARVQGRDGRPIAGLYAAGTATGGLEGGPSAGYVGGLMKSVLTGLLAAEEAAKHRSQI